ncbi:MAG TPA: glycosyltransferase [Terriglobales bacterium]|nr:glycosyltransferase [Terriglobales bacterium]
MSELTSPAGPPAEISHLVRERVEARARRDWTHADAIKAQIEAAGWRVVDRRGRSSVSQAAPASVEADGEIRYGTAAGVPSLLDAPATTAWTVAVVASESPDRVSRLLTALRTHAPAGTQVVIVANDPSDAQVAALLPDAADRAPIGGLAPELLRTSARLGYAAALNIALHRASGDLVLIADGTAWPSGDAISPLAIALEDPAVAVAGGFGLYAPDDEPLRPNALGREPGTDDAAAAAGPTALEGAWLAFRRADYIELGPLDEHFATPSWLDVWWSLRLRAGAEPEGWEVAEPTEEGDNGNAEEPSAPSTAETAASEPEFEFAEPRLAVCPDLPLEREAAGWPPDRSRLNRRNMYRVLDRFGRRMDFG